MRHDNAGDRGAVYSCGAQTQGRAVPTAAAAAAAAAPAAAAAAVVSAAIHVGPIVAGPDV
jgi:hypothetical protein